MTYCEPINDRVHMNLIKKFLVINVIYLLIKFRDYVFESNKETIRSYDIVQRNNDYLVSAKFSSSDLTFSAYNQDFYHDIYQNLNTRNKK